MLDILNTGLDQYVPETNDGNWLLEKVEKTILESIQEKKPQIALDLCKRLIQIGKLQGLGLAKVLYLIDKHWMEYDLDESFEEVAFADLGLHVHTVERYIKLWRMYELKKIPEEFESSIRQKNLMSQIPIANTIAQGYEIDNETWEELANAPDFSSVSEIVRDIKGKPPRKSSLQISMKRDGTLSAIQAGEYAHIGYLNIDDDTELCQSAIERIIRNAGILRS